MSAISKPLWLALGATNNVMATMVPELHDEATVPGDPQRRRQMAQTH